MSFAEEFGHDIPPDDWDGGGRRRSNSRRNQYSSYSHYAKEISKELNKVVEELIVETDKAYLFKFKEGKAWFPKSQVTFNEKSKKITIPEWLWLNRRYIQEDA